MIVLNKLMRRTCKTDGLQPGAVPIGLQSNVHCSHGPVKYEAICTLVLLKSASACFLKYIFTSSLRRIDLEFLTVPQNKYVLR